MLEKKNSPENAGDMHLCIARSFLDEKFLCAIEKRVTERERKFSLYERASRVIQDTLGIPDALLNMSTRE